jgi:hypothetical protein
LRHIGDYQPLVQLHDSGVGNCRKHIWFRTDCCASVEPVISKTVTSKQKEQRFSCASFSCLPFLLEWRWLTISHVPSRSILRLLFRVTSRIVRRSFSGARAFALLFNEAAVRPLILQNDYSVAGIAEAKPINAEIIDAQADSDGGG